MSDTFSFVFGDSMFRRLIKEYKTDSEIMGGKIIGKVNGTRRLPLSMTRPTFELKVQRRTGEVGVRFVDTGFNRPNDGEKKRLAEALGRSIEEIFPKTDPIIPC
jgi:hypothetical protein